MKNKYLILIFPLLIFISLAKISLADVSIACSNCIQNNCQCASNCTIGTFYVYTAAACTGIFNYSYDVNNGIVSWQPADIGRYFVKILCDDGNQSICATITVNSPATTTTSTTTTQPYSGSGNTGGCIAQGSYCLTSLECCSNLVCKNHTCSQNISAMTSTTTSSTSTTFTTTTQISETTSESTSTPSGRQSECHYFLCSCAVVHSSCFNPYVSFH